MKNTDLCCRYVISILNLARLEGVKTPKVELVEKLVELLTGSKRGPSIITGRLPPSPTRGENERLLIIPFWECIHFVYCYTQSLV